MSEARLKRIEAKRSKAAEENKSKVEDFREGIDKIRVTAKVLKGIANEDNGFSKDEVKEIKNEYGMVLEICKRILDGLTKVPSAEYHIQDDTEDYIEAEMWVQTNHNYSVSMRETIANFLAPDPSPWFGYHDLVVAWFKTAAFPAAKHKPHPEVNPRLLKSQKRKEALEAASHRKPVEYTEEELEKLHKEVMERKERLRKELAEKRQKVIVNARN